MHSSNKIIGNFGEEIAEKYLRDNQYKILEKNYRCKFGEIDIIAKEGEYIAFIEVKTRTSSLYGMPGEAVNYSKQHKISKVAQLYILKERLFTCNFRFDVIEVFLNEENNTSIKLIKDAFQIYA